MIDLPIPPTHCESKQVFAEIIQHRVNHAELTLIKMSYHTYGKDRQHRVLRKALTNYMQKEPLTPTEFGLKIYEECINE
jgi:alpha-D-ribose 1-methylphosphonate 5-triphosphate diphosphatase PhnM